MRQGFRPATMNVFAHSVARPGRRAAQGTGDQHSCPLIWFRASAAERPSPRRGELGRSSGDRGRTGPQRLLCEAGRPRYRWEWPGRGPLPRGRAAGRCPALTLIKGSLLRRAASEEDQWRPVPGHLTVDRGADDDQVITAVGQPDGPAIQLLVRGQDARADVPGPGEYAEPGRAALQAPG